MLNWKHEAGQALAAACSSFAADKHRQCILLLDDTVSLISQGHLTERQLAPTSSRKHRSASIPAYLEAMQLSGQPKLTARQLCAFRDLHECRNVLVHCVETKFEPSRARCLEFIREATGLAGEHAIPMPPLVPSELAQLQPVIVLVESSSQTARPHQLPEGLRQAAMEYCRERGILAGILNGAWPLVRCCLCESLVAIDYSSITQEDCMTDAYETVRPYCYWGCATAHQAWMRKEYGDDAYESDYYLQPTIEQVPGVEPGNDEWYWRQGNSRLTVCYSGLEARDTRLPAAER